MTSTGSEKTSVQVVVRIRPITNEDTANLPSRFQRQVLTTQTPNQIIVQSDKKQAFSYDYVFGPESTQQDVYDEAVVKLVDNFLEGYNVTILAYGQTSSGKTHTMGTADDPSIPPESKGIIPRAMQTLFSSMNSPQYKTRKFSLKVSFIEIYNEDLIDLLDESYGDSKSQVTIREDTRGNIIWNGLQEMRVNDVDDVMGHLARGSANRQVGATDMNAQSSRSHAIFSVTMIQQKLCGSSTAQAPARPSTPSKMVEPKFIRSQSSVNNLRMNRKSEEGEYVTVTSKFHFVDLAGSERLKRSAAVGERAKEGISINSGLLALGNVISALGDPNRAKHITHIPYRDSKLTRLLQDSLGGNAQTLMIACVSPAEYNLNETVNTLKYANRARNIKNTATINQEEVGWNDLEHLQNLVLKLRSEIKSLKSVNMSGNITTNGTSSGNGSNSSSGRNTPTTSNSNDNDTSQPPPSRLARPKSPLKIITTNIDKNVNSKHKDIGDLNGKLIQLQHSKQEKTLSSNNQSEIDVGDIKTNGIQEPKEGKDSNFQEAVEPVIEEYERSISSLEGSISSLESQLALVRAALNHTETVIHDQEYKLECAEQKSKQDNNLIFDLRSRIAQLRLKDEKAENYIKDIESRLESHSEEQKKDQELINELKSKVSKSNGFNSEGYIRDLESHLTKSDEHHARVSRTIEQLEKRLQERDASYAELEAKMWQTNANDEKKMLLGAIDERDRRIIQLEQRVNELVIELGSLKRLKAREYKLSGQQITHKRTTSIGSENEESATYSPTINGLSLKDEQDHVDLERKLVKLQQTHEKTVEEFTEIKIKYQACLDEISELRAQLNEARMMDSEMFDDFRYTTPSTPMTPISPQSTTSVQMTLPQQPRYEDSGKDLYSNGFTSLKKRELHRKSKSLSGDIRGSEKRDLAHLAIVQKLQMELKQHELLNENRTIGMDAFKKEFERLQMSHHATLEIVKELREEIKKRDAIAQLEVMSIMKAEQSELDELEIVSRLREEVENLKEEQKRTIEKISEYEKRNNKSEEIVQIESNIQSLRDELCRAIQEQNITNDLVTTDTKVIGENISELQTRIKELEDQLVKIQESQRLEKISETVSKLEGKNYIKPDENLESSEEIINEIKTLRMGVEKLQVKIEAKSHTIAALLLPNDDRLNIINKLESDLQKAKQAHDKLVGNVVDSDTRSSDSISDMNLSDKLEQNVDENVKELEEKVKYLELQLAKAKEVNHIPTSRSSALHIVDPTQKSIEVLQAQLTILQGELANKSDSIENLQSVNDLVTALQSQLETLKADLKRKYELIEILKRDLIDKGGLQQKLKEKEAEALTLQAQLSEVKNREEDMQKQMLQVQMQLQGVENNESLDQSLQSEINKVKKELQEVKGREASTSEYLRTLESEESKLRQELQRLENVEIAQREKIKLLETQLSEGGGGNVEENIIKLKSELALAKESEIEYKLKISELEIKLNQSEHDFSALRNKIDSVKSKAFGKNIQIQSHERQPDEVCSTTADSQEVQSLNKEIELLREQDEIKSSKIDSLENRLKHLQQDTTFSALEIELDELKIAESDLQNTIKELKSKLEIAQKEQDKVQDLRNEIAFLKDSEQKNVSVIEQLQSQIKVISEEKGSVTKELENLRKEYNTQKDNIISLETELNNIKGELSEAKEENVFNSKKLDDLSKLLKNTEQQRDEELKKIEELENQIRILKDDNSPKGELIDAINELKGKIEALEKERDEHIKRVTELTKTLEIKEIEHKKEVIRSKSSISNLENQLVEVENSSRLDQNSIANLGNRLASVGTLLGEAVASKEMHAKLARELEEKLEEAKNALFVKEKMIISKDASISELETKLQKTRKDLENAKISTNSEAKHVKELQTQLYELETKLLERPSSSELEAAKKTVAKQSELVKELEMKLASMEQSDANTNIDTVAAQLKEAKSFESELVKELEISLKDKQENLEKLQETMAKVNSELESVKKSDEEHVKLIKTLEEQLKASSDNSKSSKLEDTNSEIETLKSQCKKLQNELDVMQKEAIIKNSKDNDNDVENLADQLKKATDEAKTYRDRVEELEKITRQLETDKENQLEINSDLTKQMESLAEELVETANKCEDSGIISQEQKIRIAELEKVLEETQKQDGTLSSYKSNDSLTDGFDTYGSSNSTNSTLSKLAVANENLRQINDNLRAKVAVAEDNVISLNNNIIKLEKELSNAHSGTTIEELKGKITEIEEEKEGLEQANNAFKEDCKKLDQKVESLVKQLQLAGRGGNKTATQLADLNSKLIALEHEHANLKQKSLIDNQEIEDEITKLMDINEQLREEIVELKSQMPFDSEKSASKSQNTLKLSSLDNSVKSKLQRQESTIAQQNSLIKFLQDKISELERKTETEPRHRRPSFGSVSVTDHEGTSGSTGVRLSNLSISSNKSIRSNITNLVKSPPLTPPPNQPLPPTPPPNQALPPTPPPNQALPPTPPPNQPLPPTPIGTPRSLHSRNGSNGDLAMEIQKLHKKISKIENENSQNKRLVETLEKSLDENEINLRAAKKDLQTLQKEKAELNEQIKALRIKLDETTTQLNARSSVYEEKKVIETVLEEERKAKENAENARRKLESRMEELMAKKKQSFLHPLMTIINRTKPLTKHTSSTTSSLSEDPM